MSFLAITSFSTRDASSLHPCITFLALIEPNAYVVLSTNSALTANILGWTHSDMPLRGWCVMHVVFRAGGVSLQRPLLNACSKQPPFGVTFLVQVGIEQWDSYIDAAGMWGTETLPLSTSMEASKTTNDRPDTTLSDARWPFLRQIRQQALQ